ncbi:hypothetical protein CONCODRAFT_9739 [Conidiobolus coronatus NRRL 28638]|uniref:G-protein coupled receptors family 1 profile domain-containing protein n=1 Tax=Conidiobolus coronatus (strain ATCC 28846 / CBS 209.66 / NRRL 28638) TaxID=796925 RepID=A0A137NZH0_CONC2|nr:hypothetical protein CONCODRAFT_9739 [Conidiobolus coronatus NRRL 28638]|eukprot:KXN68098.1 hypothetical protein CONCODRAFT_9739 [Conidiobolus coronatus NRRL 28638]
MEENLEIYNNTGPNASRIQLVYTITGSIGLPVTFTVLFATFMLLKKKTTIDLKISLCVLIADFITLVCLVLVGLMARYNGLYIVYHKWFCNFIVILFGNIAYLSIYYVGLMSLERGLLIIHNIKLPNAFWLTLMIGEMIYFALITTIAASSGQLSLVALEFSCFIIPSFELGIIITYSYLSLLTWNLFKNIRELRSNKEITLRKANRKVATGETRPGINDLISTTLILLGPIVNSIILVQLHCSVKLWLLETLPLLKVVFNYDPSTSLNHNQLNTAINENTGQS